MANVVIDIASEFTGAKAFKQADFATSKLTKSVKNLAATFGVTFSVRALVNYSKVAVKAFAADDKAARTLTQTLNNLGLAFADTEVKKFISDLEKQFGVLDDLLRPAYQKLITTTGDFRKSQDLLKVALDLSAQSGYDVVSVSNDLSQALIGNTKGLRKYSLGLTTAQLSAMSFEEVLARITKISAGQASLAADTYSGKLDKLKVAAANAEEVLGGAFLDTFIKLSGGDVDKATAAIDKYSTGLATMLRLLTGVISKQEVLSKVDFKFGLIPVEKGKVSTNRSASPAGTFMRNAAEIKAANAAKKLAADQAKTQKALTKTQQDALKLAKARAVFDLQKIQIEAALKGKISEEDAIRLKLMKAIEEENLTNIEKYQKALEVAQAKSKELANALVAVQAIEVGNPFSQWPNYVKTAIELTNTVAQASLKAGLDAGNALAAALSGARYAAQGSAAADAAANKATLDAINSGTAEQKAATEAEFKAQQEALTAASAAQLRALRDKLAGELEAFQELSDATAAAAEAAILTGAPQGVSGNLAKIAGQAAAQEMAAAAALASAQSAMADDSTTTQPVTQIEITVNTGVGDPNAIAEAIAEVLRGAGQRGTLELAGFE